MKILVLMHVVGQVDDGELRRVGARKQSGIAGQKGDGCVLAFLHGDRFTNRFRMVEVVWLVTNNSIISGID